MLLIGYVNNSRFRERGGGCRKLVLVLFQGVAVRLVLIRGYTRLEISTLFFVLQNCLFFSFFFFAKAEKVRSKSDSFLFL